MALSRLLLLLTWLSMALCTIPCVTTTGVLGTLDCSGQCLTSANCTLSISGYSTCSQWYTDVTCDDGTRLAADDGTKPNWNCPYYACDLNQCSPCGSDPATGTCGTDYTCSNGGSCGASGCVCKAGYSGFVCEYGVGVCPDDFACVSGSCSGGVCACDQRV